MSHSQCQCTRPLDQADLLFLELQAKHSPEDIDPLHVLRAVNEIHALRKRVDQTSGECAECGASCG